MNTGNSAIRYPRILGWLLLLFPGHILFASSHASDSELIARIQLLDKSYQELTHEYYEASASTSEPIDNIDQLYELVTHLNNQRQFVEANRLIFANQKVIANNPDHPAIVRLVESLLNDNQRQLAETIYGLVENDGDEVSLSNLKFIFAKYHARHNQWYEVNALVKDIIPDLSGNHSDYAYLLQGSALQYLKKHRQSVDSYVNIPATSPYYIHAQFNTALASIRQGWITEAKSIINKIISLSHQTDNNELSNRIHLVLGFALLQKEYFRDARQAFRNVSLDSRYANRALMGISLTAISQGDYVGGLNSVSVLKQQKGDNLTTDEAYLLLPYIYEKLDQPLSTANSFLESIDYYQQRLLALDSLKINTTSFDKIQFENHSDDLLLGNMHFAFSKHYPVYLFINRQSLSTLATVQTSSKQAAAIQQLLRNHDRVILEVISSLMDQRRRFLTSYLNQSRFGLARHYDSQQEVP